IMEDYQRIADYFVVAGHTDSSLPLDEDLAFPNAQHKLSDQRKDPITDISFSIRTLEESCPQGFTCIELTPTGFPADLNYGSLTAHNLLLCYRRGKDKPPLIDLGVFYEGLETVRAGISILETTPAGRSANVNNKSGMGSHPIYLTFRRAKESAPQNALAVTDICIIFTNKGEKAPYAFCQIEKNLNKGLIGANVYLCYKKSMRQVDSIAFKAGQLHVCMGILIIIFIFKPCSPYRVKPCAGFIGRYPTEDTGSFSLPASVPLFCLPMGATIECWSSKTRHPLPTFSSFVLTTETSDKVFGAVVSFYESYPEEKLTEEQKYKLGILRGDGQRSKSQKTVHTNKAICLLSRWPMFSAFRDFLMYLYRLTVSPQAHSVPVERHIAHFMHNVPFPTAQRPRVQYQMSPMHATILTRPQITPIPLSGASFLALLDDLGPENTLTLLILALTEHKIVIHSLRPAEITCVAEALITLLFPFKWRCTYVPLCPLEMGYVMEAPCPFIVGVDSRYFDIYEPPSDVACVNLDTNSITLMEEKKNISWKMLPKKPAKLLKATLQKYFKEVKDCPREDLNGGSMLSLQDPDLSRTERHRKIDLAIQEAVLKLTASLMKGYRQFLLPITEAPNPGTADPSSLFNIQEFVRSRERSSQRFYQSVVGTQLFSSFIEERCLTSSASLVFFDECIDRLTPDHDHVHLIETDDSQTSDHTVMIMPPDEKGLPPGVGYQYTLFPELQDELFDLGEEDLLINESSTRGRRKSDTFTFGHRTKQELRTMQKLSKFHSGDPQLWARLLISHTYGAWFACLPAFVIECRHKSAALRTAHDALYALKEKNCIPLPDETYYRMLLHLCAVYNKPALAVRVFQFVRKTGIQLSAITYGLYNKAVLEGTWPSSNRDGYMLWQKLRNVFLATKRFQYGLQRRSKFAGSDVSSDLDSTSHTSVESSHLMAPPAPPEVHIEEVDAETCLGGQSDHGYNSMPKEQIRRGSPHKGLLVTQTMKTTQEVPSASGKHCIIFKNMVFNQPLAISARKLLYVSPQSLPHHTPSNTGRSVQPPNTLDIPEPQIERVMEQHTDPGLRSDETLVNGEVGDPMASLADESKPSESFCLQMHEHYRMLYVMPVACVCRLDWSAFSQLIERDTISHRPRSVAVSPALHRKPAHGSFKFNHTSSTGSTGGGLASLDVACPDTVAVTNNSNLSSNKSINTMHGSEIIIPALNVSAKDELTTNLLTPNKTKSSSDGISAFKTPNPTSGDSLTPGISPATPELGNLFGGDAKFLSSLSDSDQLRYQELCSHRNPSAEDSSDVSKSPRYNHSLLSRGRASTSLYPGQLCCTMYNYSSPHHHHLGNVRRLPELQVGSNIIPGTNMKMSVPNSTKVARQDISNLEVDPLSPFTKPSTTPEESQPTPAAPGTSDIEVTISSCSKCHKCESLVYDEEIMAGWIADESSLNTHCPFCNSLFVPFLNIEIKNLPPQSPLSTKSSATEESHSTRMSIGDSQSELNSQIAPQILEPVTIPYLSSLVLRKELESLLENEGTKVLTDPGFVDNHPILYWNLVWYFRRLNLHTNLYKILLRSQLVQQNCKVIPSKKDNVVIHLMWDNLKLHMVGEKPPLYCAWHQRLNRAMRFIQESSYYLATLCNVEEFATYSQSFLNDIKDSIMQDDVLGPLVAVLNELNAQRGIRRSAYREILYLIIVALGKSSIDIIAFDREYRRAFDLLSPSERALTRKCDRPPSDHAVDCREIFGELDL
uniref:UDENN domain-containing protein n=1 Tax=Ciona savignyi TaxID=51511 RepID=H2ZEE4_CIOSA